MTPFFITFVLIVALLLIFVVPMLIKLAIGMAIVGVIYMIVTGHGPILQAYVNRFGTWLVNLFK